MPSYVLGTPIDATAAAEAGGLSSSSSSSRSNSSRLELALRGPISEARAQATKRQEVLDERGRPLRFHGAFTGGFSAGYFNTVGSKEGWAPSSFVSSRTNKAETLTSSTSSISTGIQALDAMKPFMDAEDEESMGALLVARSSYRNSEGGGGGGGGGGEKKRSREESHRGLVVDLVVKDRGDDSIGIKLLELCGWRKGQRVGLAFALRRARRGLGGVIPKTEEEAVARLACIESERKLEQQQELELDALWKNATSRPPNAKFGVSFDPHSVRQRQSATEQIRNTSSTSSDLMLGNGEGVGTVNGNRSKLQMSSSALLGFQQNGGVGGGAGGNSLLATLGSAGLRGGIGKSNSLSSSGGALSMKRRSLQQPLYSSRTSGGLLSFDIDDDGEDDASAYRQPSLLEYDIQSTSGAVTGYSTSLNKNEKLTHHGSSSSASSSTANNSSSLLIADHFQNGIPSSLRSKDNRLCADGRPPLAGFSLATRLDVNVFDFAKSHKPPTPPLGWIPRHEFASKEPQPLSLYSQFGYYHNETRCATDTTTATESSTRIVDSTGQSVSAHLPVQISQSSSEQSSTTTFFDKFSKGESASNEGGSSRDTKEAIPISFLARIPKIGSTNERSTSTFLPSKLLLKRFNVADPFSASERQRLSNPAVTAATATQSEHLARVLSSQSASRDMSKSLQSVPIFSPPSSSSSLSLSSSSSSQLTVRPPPDISSATAAAQKIAATLAPILHRPPPSLFEAIFGASFTT